MLPQGGASELVAVPSPIARLINSTGAVASGADPSLLTAGGGLSSASGLGGTADELPGAVSPGSVAESLLPFLHGTGALYTKVSRGHCASRCKKVLLSVQRCL